MKLELRDALGAFRINVPYTLISCIDRERRLLMLRRKEPPFVDAWNFVGGKIEADETPSSSARRELWEEARLDAPEEELRFRGIAIWPSSFKDGEMLGMFLFSVRVRSSRRWKRQLSLAEEGTLAWLPVDLLEEAGALRAVPNFGLLLPLFTSSRRLPRVLIHDQSRDGRYFGIEVPMARSLHGVHRRMAGRLEVTLDELVGSFIQDEDLLAFFTKVQYIRCEGHLS